MQTISYDVQRSLLNKKSVLGVHFDQNLSWNEHLNSIIRSFHGTLKALRKFIRFTSFRVRKILAEAYILSKINYANTIYAQIPNNAIQRLHTVQNIVAGYVLQMWLPIKEYLDSCTVKLEHKSRFNDNFDYLRVEMVFREGLI